MKKTAVYSKIQDLLWNLPPASSENHSGVLTICKGLPVLVKYNQSTECCITNGAEGVIVDWQISDLDNKSE